MKTSNQTILWHVLQKYYYEPFPPFYCSLDQRVPFLTNPTDHHGVRKVSSPSEPTAQPRIPLPLPGPPLHPASLLAANRRGKPSLCILGISVSCFPVVVIGTSPGRHGCRLELLLIAAVLYVTVSDVFLDPACHELSFCRRHRRDLCASF